jgi:DNA-binding protein H-NS
MLRRVIATGVTGLGISAVAMVPPAMPEENSLLLLQQQISRLTEAIQRRMEADEERFKRIEEDIRQLKRRPDNTTTTAQPITAQPITAQPITAQPSSVRPPRHRHYHPRYVWRPPPRWEPWW